jgi:transcriptional regulator
MPGRREADLPERQSTLRAALKQVLTGGHFTARELSARVGISEKDVAGHLDHLARSLKTTGQRFDVDPAECHGCGFVFRDRTRLGKPSRCPRCRGQRLAPARYGIRPA